MRLSRRLILKSAGTLPLLAGSFGLPLLGVRAWAQTAPVASRPAEVPPVLFVHGNGDHAALWITTLWRMESNGVPRERMLAINFTDPLARTDDKVEQQTGPRPKTSAASSARPSRNCSAAPARRAS